MDGKIPNEKRSSEVIPFSRIELKGNLYAWVSLLRLFIIRLKIVFPVKSYPDHIMDWVLDDEGLTFDVIRTVLYVRAALANEIKVAVLMHSFGHLKASRSKI